MKRQNKVSLFLFLICSGIGVIFLASCQAASVSSSLSTPEISDQEGETTLPDAVGDFLADKTVYDDANELPDVTVDEVKTDLTALEQINLAYVRRPGWWHVVRRTWTNKHEINQQNRGESTEWEAADLLPPVQIDDRWFQITDDEGSFGKAGLTVFSDDEGNPVQVLVSDEEGNGGNLTTMEHELPEYLITPPRIAAEVDALPPQKLGSDLREIIEWLDAIRYISEIQAGIIQNGEAEVYFLRIQTHVQGEPHELQWLPEPVTGYILTYQIDLTTGNLIETTDTAIGESGTAYLDRTEALLVYERYDDLPDEARQGWLAYMDQYWALVESQGE